jgi:hypothetical protein
MPKSVEKEKVPKTKSGLGVFAIFHAAAPATRSQAAGGFYCWTAGGLAWYK